MKFSGTKFTNFWRSRKLAHDQRGFTLAEVLVAMTIFAVGLLAIAGMQLTAIQANSRANLLSAESLLAQGVKEEILARSGNAPIFSADAANVAWGTETVGSVVYTVTYSITAAYVQNIAMVTVTVTGGRTDGRVRTATVTGFKNRLEG